MCTKAQIPIFRLAGIIGFAAQLIKSADFYDGDNDGIYNQLIKIIMEYGILMKINLI
ncbi:MAG: hypothetical protein H6609_01680 [Ignavibacteriales bacterium]|nr:hypothetical protein [Ignavibacteriales bacterium]